MRIVLIFTLMYFEALGIYSAINRVFLICNAQIRIRQLKKNKRK